MKKYIFLFILIGFSILLCHSQYKKSIKIDSVRKELLDSLVKLKIQTTKLELKIVLIDSINNIELNDISKNADSLSKSILGNRLNETLKTADKTISYQSSFIQIFGVVIAILALFAGFIYFFSIRPIIQQANIALERANQATDRTNVATDKFELKLEKFNEDVDQKINTRFDHYEVERKEAVITEIFIDIESNLPNQRKLQIEKLTTLNSTCFSSERIDRLFKLIDSLNLTESEKATIIEVLIQIDNYQTNKYFETWYNIRNEEVNITNTLYFYYMSKGFKNYLYPISKIILYKVEPHLEFNRILDMLPSHPKDFLLLINCELLVNSLNDYSRENVKEFIMKNYSNSSLINKDEIIHSYLFHD